MEQMYSINLSANEINFICDSIDSYYYTISRLVDDNARQNINQIVQNIFAQIDSLAQVQQEQVVADGDGIVIDVEPEIIIDGEDVPMNNADIDEVIDGNVESE